MGDPKRQRKKFDSPRFPWQIDTLEAELKLLGEYGLRNKREIWRHKTLLSKYRSIGRSLLGKSIDERETQEKQLLGRLNRLGILHGFSNFRVFPSIPFGVMGIFQFAIRLAQAAVYAEKNNKGSHRNLCRSLSTTAYRVYLFNLNVL